MSSQAPSVVVRYKLAFRNDLSRIHSLDIPIERLDGVSLDIEALWECLKQDENGDLLNPLLRDFSADFRRWSKDDYM